MVRMALFLVLAAVAACGDDSTDAPLDGGGGDGDADADADADGDADADADGDADECAEPFVDVDGDGACRPIDCDDESAAVHPGRDETCGNALDDDCDGQVDQGCLAGTNSYYVDGASIGGPCSDANPGTLEAPWCTVSRANEALAPGDTVYLRAGQYAGQTIEPARSGDSDEARITYAGYEGEIAILTQSVYCVRLQDRSYVSILDLRFVDCERNLYLSGSSHVNVGHCSFDNPAGPVTWAGSRIYDRSQYNRIYRSTFSRYGMETDSGGAWDDGSCVLDIGNDNEIDESDHNLVVDSTFFHGGHHVLGVYSNDNVVRGNTFHNEEWYACHRDGGLCGNRDVILNSSFPDANVRNVIEDNHIVFSGLPADNDSSSGLSLRTQHNIVRRNTFYYCDSAGVALSNDGGNTNDASDNHIYGNVFFHNGYPLFDEWDPTKSGMMLARWVDDAEHNAMLDVAIKNNVFFENQLYGIYFYYVDRAEQAVSDNWEEEGDPGFVSVSGVADPIDFDVFDFHLQETSPCIDNGGFLTRTTAAGSDATTIAVEDAGYFSDGKGLVEGDLVQLEGQPVALLVTAVDVQANTLTIASPASWEAGIGVSLPYFGAAPDQGVHEHAGAR